MDDSQWTKSELRRSLLKLRQSITVQEWQEKSLQLCSHLQAWHLFAQAETVLAYFSIRQEPELKSLFTLPKVWGFPRCVDKALVWHRWSPENSLPLQKGSYGILEPHPDAPIIEPNAVDLLLVPAIACDRRGYRLGYGGGFYDRLLSAPGWAGKTAIAIVFDFACLPSLPKDSWDQPLQAVCTESGLFLLNEMGSGGWGR